MKDLTIKIFGKYNMIIFIICFLHISCIDKITTKHGPFSELDYEEMRNEANKVSDFILNYMINSNSTNNNISNHTDSLICKTCLWTFTKFHNLLDKKYGIRILDELLAILCSVATDYQVCRKAIYLYSPVVLDSILEHYLDAEYLCSYKFICKFSHYVELNPDEYARDLLKDKPKNNVPKINPNASTLKFLHVTDIHTDLEYSQV